MRNIKTQTGMVIKAKIAYTAITGSNNKNVKRTAVPKQISISVKDHPSLAICSQLRYAVREMLTKKEIIGRTTSMASPYQSSIRSERLISASVKP